MNGNIHVGAFEYDLTKFLLILELIPKLILSIGEEMDKKKCYIISASASGIT